jgi:hypothetical protein
MTPEAAREVYPSRNVQISDKAAWDVKALAAV